MTDTREPEMLEQRLRQAFAHRAAATTVREPWGDAVVVDLAASPNSRRPRRPRALVRGAAALVVALAGGALAVWSLTDSEAGDVTSGSGSLPAPSSVTPRTPEGVPAAMTVPESLALWDASWQSYDTAITDLYPPEWAQLFGDAEDPEVLLLIESFESMPTGGQDAANGPATGTVTVRGEEALVGNMPGDDGLTGIRSLYWQEGGTFFSASFRGMTQDEAAAAVDGLRLPSDDAAAGFDPPADGSMVLLDEVFDPAQTPRGADFTYFAEQAPTGGPAGPPVSGLTVTPLTVRTGQD